MNSPSSVVNDPPRQLSAHPPLNLRSRFELATIAVIGDSRIRGTIGAEILHHPPTRR